MTKHADVVVASFGLEGVHVNPKRSGGSRWTVPFTAARKAAVASGIDTYVSRLDAGVTIRMKANNRCFVPALKAFRTDDSEDGGATQEKAGVSESKPKASGKNGKNKGGARKATPRKKNSELDLSLLNKAQVSIVNNLIRMGEKDEARKLAAKFSS
jgi:hypothetical protein